MPLPDNPLGPTSKEVDQEVWILVEYVSKIDGQGSPDGYSSFKIIGAFDTRDGARTTRQFMEQEAKELSKKAYSNPYNLPSYQIETRTVRKHPDVDETKLRRQEQQRVITEKINKLEADLRAHREELRNLK